MLIKVVTAGSPLEAEVAALRVRQIEDVRGCALSWEQRDAIRHSSSRCIRLADPVARTRTFVGIKRGLAVSYLDCVPHHDHVANSGWLKVNGFTVPQFRQKGFMRALLELTRLDTGLGCHALAPNTITTRTILGKLQFVTPDHICLERRFDASAVKRNLEARTWRAPCFSVNGYSVSAGDMEDHRAIYNLQQRLDCLLGYSTSPAQMYRGIGTVLEQSPVDLYRTGVFICLRRGENVVGTAKVFAEFAPLRNRWVLYVRHLVIDPNHRGRGLLDPLVKGSVALATLAMNPDDRVFATPIVVRSYVDNYAPLLAAFRKAGFHLVPRVLGSQNQD